MYTYTFRIFYDNEELETSSSTPRIFLKVSFKAENADSFFESDSLASEPGDFVDENIVKYSFWEWLGRQSFRGKYFDTNIFTPRMFYDALCYGDKFNFILSTDDPTDFDESAESDFSPEDLADGKILL